MRLSLPSPRRIMMMRPGGRSLIGFAGFETKRGFKNGTLEPGVKAPRPEPIAAGKARLDGRPVEAFAQRVEIMPLCDQSRGFIGDMLKRLNQEINVAPIRLRLAKSMTMKQAAQENTRDCRGEFTGLCRTSTCERPSRKGHATAKPDWKNPFQYFVTFSLRQTTAASKPSHRAACSGAQAMAHRKVKNAIIAIASTVAIIIVTDSGAVYA